MNDYVQYGCGLKAPSSWNNFDASPTLRLQRLPLLGKVFKSFGVGPEWPDSVMYGDIVKGLPIELESCSAVYCSHVLEHLSLKDFKASLDNTYKYLKKGGVFRFVLPDIEIMIKKYIESEDPGAAVNLIRSTRMGLSERPRGIRGLLMSAYGNSGHRWMWDYKSIKDQLSKHGFKKIRRAQFGDSELPVFSEVEEDRRWQGALGVECWK